MTDFYLTGLCARNPVHHPGLPPMKLALSLSRKFDPSSRKSTGIGRDLRALVKLASKMPRRFTPTCTLRVVAPC